MGVVDRKVIGPNLSSSINATQTLIDSHTEYAIDSGLYIDELEERLETEDVFDGYDELVLSALGRMTGKARQFNGQ